MEMDVASKNGGARGAGTDRLARSAPAVPASDRETRLGDLPDQFGFLVRRAQLWVFREFTRRLAGFDVTPAQYSVMTVVGAHPGINQLAVASALTIERAGLGRLMERLEARDMLQRLPSTADRRSYVLHLTPKGRKVLVGMAPSVYEVEKRLAEKLGPDHFEHLKQLLSTFRDD
jgi:DNA-binding MarR family transcriptional regulator